MKSAVRLDHAGKAYEMLQTVTGDINGTKRRLYVSWRTIFITFLPEFCYSSSAALETRNEIPYQALDQTSIDENRKTASDVLWRIKVSLELFDLLHSLIWAAFDSLLHITPIMANTLYTSSEIA